MKRLFFVSTLVMGMVLGMGINAFAGWVITLPDATVNANSTVDYDFYGEWDDPIVSLVIPMVVREIDAGSFWTGTLPVDTISGTPVGVQWKWDVPTWAVLIEEFRPGVPEAPFCYPEGDIGYDGVSPDHMVIAATGIFAESAAPAGRSFLTITFEVTGTPGDFEIDTSCFLSSLNAIYMVDNSFPPVDHGSEGTGELVFTKGTITIVDACDCSSAGDCNGDGSINPIDVVYLVNYAFKGGPAPFADAQCPMINRADWNCDDAINLLDIVKIVNYVFRYPAPGPCDPCAD